MLKPIQTCARLSAATAWVIGCLCLTGASEAAGQSGFASPQAKAPPEQTIFSLAGYTDAFCNDGTPGAYYFRKSTTGSLKWLFYLEGGQQCHDNATCQKNVTGTAQKTTSTGWRIKSPVGILSPSASINPALFDANVVEVHACSSDDWSGAKTPTEAFLPGNADVGWYFQGRAIALATIQDIAARDAQTGFLSASDILFGGSSGGGLGIVYIINDLLPWTPADATKHLAVDAGFSLQIYGYDKKAAPTYMNADNPYTDLLAAGIPFWNGHGDTACASVAASLDDQIACYDTSWLLSNGSVAMPVFIAQSELDTNQMSKHHYSGNVYQDDAHTGYATAFVNAMMAALQATVPGTAVFAPQRQTHTMFSGTAQFTNQEQFPGGTMSPSDALAAWYNTPTDPIVMFGDADGLP